MSTDARRLELQDRIYAPIRQLDPDSMAYLRVAHSGKCWADYHEPEKMDAYLALQEKHKSLLIEIDKLRESSKSSFRKIAKSLVDKYAHQSCFIEANPMKLEDIRQISDVVEAHVSGSYVRQDGIRLHLSQLPQGVRLDYLPAGKLKTLALPSIDSLALPGSVSLEDVAELRNHILISKWTALIAPQNPDTSGMSLAEIRALAALLTRGTDTDNEYLQWGRKTPPGDYRLNEHHDLSKPMRIFPYPFEVSGLMERWTSWRHNSHLRRLMHPLLMACHQMVYFCAIHPFRSGNGLVSRCVMHDFMVRQGYVPVVRRDLDTQKYHSMLSDAMDGNPEAFVSSTLTAEYETRVQTQGKHLQTS